MDIYESLAEHHLDLAHYCVNGRHTIILGYVVYNGKFECEVTVAESIQSYDDALWTAYTQALEFLREYNK